MPAALGATIAHAMREGDKMPRHTSHCKLRNSPSEMPLRNNSADDSMHYEALVISPKENLESSLKSPAGTGSRNDLDVAR